MANCLICGYSVEEVISFGKMPLANGFLLPEEFTNEYFYDLKLGFCSNCTMVQLTELVDKQRMLVFLNHLTIYFSYHFPINAPFKILDLSIMYA